MSNTSVTDKSGQGNHGTMTNMNTKSAIVSGKLGQGLEFDGVNDYVDMGDPTNGSLDFGTGNMTISFWTKTAVGYRDQGCSSNHLVSKMADDDFSASYAIAIDSTQ